MNAQRTLALWLVALLVFSCRDMGNVASLPPVDRSSSNGMVWVFQIFSGGRQCDTSSHYTPPDVRELLGTASVGVSDTKIVGLAVCAACGCPTYAANHYALIQAYDLEKAQGLGFQRSEEPK
ncbi:MAG: hypothetical protein HY966_03185 [Ignavibacteriales bacterium]|nr:hypothetical protein [Ignavibacteriales bacterium]